ncbi:hypothetical protein LCGC14_2773080, partial [marine sediment metagenome]
MKKIFIILTLLLITFVINAQSGHVSRSVGGRNANIINKSIDITDSNVIAIELNTTGRSDADDIIVTHTIYVIDATGNDSLQISDDGDTARIFSNNNPIKIGEGSLVIHEDSLWISGVKLENDEGCLATNEIHLHGKNGVSGYLKIKQGTTPTAHKEEEHLILWIDSNNKLYLERPDGTDIEVGSIIADSIKVVGNNAILKLEDDSGNFGIIKAGNSQLTIQADPDNVVASTDIVFDMDGSEVARFLQGGNFGVGTIAPTEKIEVEGNVIAQRFATKLWDV